MNKLPYMKISEFSKKTGISRDNLIFYDKTGLLSPAYRAENNYRYYTYHQLGLAYLILELRTIGLSIEDIKKFCDKRTPEKMLALFSEQEKEIDAQIIKLKKIKGAMRLFSNLVKETSEDDIRNIVIKELPEQEIFVGSLLDPITAQSYEDANLEFYKDSSRKNLDLIYPFGIIVSKDNLLKDDYSRIMRCFFSVPYKGNDVRPAGRYVIGHMFEAYGKSSLLFKKLLDYIKKHDLTICGNAYEEYPLNEVTTVNDEEYLIRIAIQIK